MTGSDLMPADRRRRAFYELSLQSPERLLAFADEVPSELEPRQVARLDSDNTFSSDLHRQAQLAVLAFKTGVAVSADLWQGGFDTHATHDSDHRWLLERLTDGV